ncbi:MAG: PLP-dependent aminotransferase family protein, partial [Bacillota bacterium]
MHLSLDRTSPEPLPQQIRRALADRIRSGLIPPGERLPTVRRLAEQLGVSPVTVMQAYATLEAAGLVSRVQGSGVYVRERPEAPPEGRKPEPYGWQRGLPDYIPRSLAGHLTRTDLPPRGIPMHVAIVDAGLLQVMELVNAIRNAALNDPARLGWYSPTEGVPELREAVAAHLRRMGMAISAGEVLITQGAQQGIDLVARTFTGPGDAVAVESPCYPPIIDAFLARGARLHPIPVDGEGMQVDRLAEIPGLRLACVVPNFQNPTGAVLSRRRRASLLELARRRGFLILEDDPWSEFAFGGRALPPSLKSQDPDGHVIYLKSFSKLLSVGVRLGAAVASGLVFERLVAAKRLTDLGVSLLPQLAVTAVLQSPRLQRHLQRMIGALRERRDAVLEALTAHAPRAVRWSRPGGGLNIWLTLPPHVDPEALLRAAEARGILFAPGTGFFVGDPEGSHLRLSFGAAPPADLQRGVRELCALMEEG